MKSMNILMVAPQPFLRARGTPFSVFHRIRSLLHLGHTVDLITYPYGEDVVMEGLRIMRCRRPLGVRDVPIGPSFGKALTDVNLFRLAWRTAREGAYDLLHTHEEAGALGALLHRRMGIPHLYDMHSSLPQQFDNFGRFNVRPVVAVFEGLERYTLNGADGVIAICQALSDRARQVGYEGPLSVIENTLDFTPPPESEVELRSLRGRLGLGKGPVAVYTGTLEHYQGLDLLVQAAAALAHQLPELRFLVVGGTEEGSAALAKQAKACGAESNVVCVPAVPPQEVPRYHRLADILVTTRTRGTNTPLKLYQYLRSGRPMVATDIFSHTQVLDSSCAELVSPDPAAIAAGIKRLVEDPQRREELARGAETIARERYGEERYHSLLGGLLEQILDGATPVPGAAA